MEEVTSENWDSDGSLSWEDFFGQSSDLLPTLLGMYDALIARSDNVNDEGSVADCTTSMPAKQQPEIPAPAPPLSPKRVPVPDRLLLQLPVSRPLSLSSIASSSSSSSSGTGSRRLAGVQKSSAYLASIESLDDSDPEPRGKGGGGGNVTGLLTPATMCAGSGSGDSGVCSPRSPSSLLSSPSPVPQGHCSLLPSLPPLPPLHRPRHYDANLSFIDRVVLEILDTEGVYVRDLHQIVVGYLDFWRCQPDSPLAPYLDALFGNLEDVYRFNAGLLSHLERSGLDPVRVARCFVNHNHGFAIYTEYCTNYPRKVSVLTDLMRRESTSRLFRERQLALQHPLPLGSYLLKPVQRILKYHLLLQNIVKHSSRDKEGYEDLVHALSTMTSIAQHINNMKRKHEHAVRVQEIQSLLYGWQGEDLTTFGELCAEGTFKMAGAKALRHAFLFDKMLLITKKKEKSILFYKAHISSSNLMLVESVPREPLCFHVIPFDNPRIQYTLQARNLEQKREWTLQLKRVILENYNAVIPLHARQLVMELGQNRIEDEPTSDKAPKRQHSAPEYLERRKHDRTRRKSEGALRCTLRRARKLASAVDSESATRIRARRLLSINRDRRSHCSANEEKKERLDDWRRKSEPTCYNSKDSLSPITLDPIQLPEDQSAPSDVSANTTLSSANDTSVNTTPEVRPPEVQTSALDPNDETTQTIEEIVSQLLMQNREFQRILKKQQRQINMRHRITPYSLNRDETSDEEEAIYETLSALATVQTTCQTASTRKQPNSRPQTVCSNDEDDYVTLVCQDDLSTSNLALPERVPPLASPEKDTVSIQSEPIDFRIKVEDEKKVDEVLKTVGDRDYHSIWERLRRSHGRGKKTSELEKIACRVRRAQSFNSYTDNERRSCFYVESPALEESSLNDWLNQHEPPGVAKAGSLPRSFPTGIQAEATRARSCLLRDGRQCPDRPFTIASDKPQIDFLEERIFRSGDTTEEDSLTEYTSTPTVSMNELNIHPEYKIYRPSISKTSLKNVISSMTKLAGLRISSETLDSGAVNRSEWGPERSKAVQRERRVNRAAAVIVKQYSRTLRKRIKNLMGEDSATETASIEPVSEKESPSYKQGSSNLGARIAHCSETEYADPRVLFAPIRPPEKAASLLGIRPPSVMSISSNLTSSSDGDKTSGFGGSVDTTLPLGQTCTEPKNGHVQCDNGVDSDGSADSFYERSFEAMESLMEADMFRDSAVFSDHDGTPDSSDSANEFQPISQVLSTLGRRKKVPPPVPAKPKTLEITAHVDSTVNLQSCCAASRGSDGSFSEGRELDECDTSSQYSAASTVIEMPEPVVSNGHPDIISPTSRGWVRHVIGRLQGASQQMP